MNEKKEDNRDELLQERLDEIYAGNKEERINIGFK